jgi:putative FmdB family regulatory protein
MPTYEYVCKNCGKRFDVFQPFSAKALKRHDECGGEVQRVIHPRGIVFKGSGFYATDSRSKAATVATATSEKSKTTEKSQSSGDSDKGSSSSSDPD